MSDSEKRRIYDETGVIDGDDAFHVDNDRDWDSYWRQLFKKVTEEDIKEFFKGYKNSEEEKEDLKKVYLKHKGDMNLILEDMISSSVLEDEERFRDILRDAIKNNEIEDFKKFTSETKTKKDKRKLKYEKEAIEAEELKKELGYDGDVAKAIAHNQQNRKKMMDNFFNNLEEKYGKKENMKKISDGASKTSKRAKK